LGLRLKYLTVIRWIVRKITKFWDLSRGDCQAYEKKQNGEDPTHDFIPESAAGQS
jgi:hypothetical protein